LIGGGSRIYRYYTSGDEFLQINTTGGADVDDIDDIKLFVYVQSDGISQEKHWRSAISPASIGTPTFSWRQQRWQRFFNGGEPGNIAPVYMLEKVENQQHAVWEVHNFTMGYQRQVAEEMWEYLLLNGEESFNDRGESEWLFSYALGVDIPLTSLDIIGNFTEEKYARSELITGFLYLFFYRCSDGDLVSFYLFKITPHNEWQLIKIIICRPRWRLAERCWDMLFHYPARR
jgi:hypothetical protein